MANELQGMDAEKKAASCLKSHFPDAEIETNLGPGKVDIQAQILGHRLLVEVKSLRQPRVHDVIGQLAAGALQIRSLSKGKDVPLILLGLPKVGDHLVSKVDEFMSLHAPEIAWGIFDDSGKLRLMIAKLGINIFTRPTRSTTHVNRIAKSKSLFSDLNRWMLKIILLSEAPNPGWGGPRTTIYNATDLAKVAKVSAPTAHQFVNTFSESGFLVSGTEGLTIPHKNRLMDVWFHSEVAHKSAKQPVRSIFGKPSRLAEVLTPNSPTYAIAGYEACRALGVLHTPPHRSEIYVASRDVSRALETWALEYCDARDADFWINEAMYPRSIFDGKVLLAGIWFVDLLQAALDVSTDPARGNEQAHHVIREVLKWNT